MRKDPEPVEVTVKIDLEREPITGRVIGADGHDHAFAGWLELMDVLDQARAPTAHRQPTTVPEEK
jgi:hypothetical protein